MFYKKAALENFQNLLENTFNGIFIFDKVPAPSLQLQKSRMLGYSIFHFWYFFRTAVLRTPLDIILQILFSPFPYIRRVVLSFFLVDVQLISRKISLIGFYKIIKNKTKKLYFLSTDISLRFQVAQIYITLVNCFDRI